MDITIKKDKITEISNITANTNSTNKAYTNDAKKGMVSKIVANGNADGVNTVSGAVLLKQLKMHARRHLMRQRSNFEKRGFCVYLRKSHLNIKKNSKKIYRR